MAGAKTILLVIACFIVSYGGFLAINRQSPEAKKSPASVQGRTEERGEPVHLIGTSQRAERDSPIRTDDGNNAKRKLISDKPDKGNSGNKPTRFYPGQTVREWIAQLEDDNNDKESRVAAAIAISHIGADAAAAIPQLMLMLDSKDKYIFGAAAMGLAGIGQPAIPALTKSAKSQNASRFAGAIITLKLMGSGGVPALADLLSDQRSHVQLVAVRTLGEMGEKAKAAIPALIQALNAPDREVAIEASVALVRIGKAAIPALAKTLKGKNPSYLVINVLMKFGDEGTAAVTRATKHPDSAIRIYANVALESRKKK